MHVIITLLLFSWADLQVLPAALRYSRIRILGAPASIAAMVLQAACLGARDSVTPLGVVIVASAINAGGDWLTVCRMNMGVLGAAAATASAETVSMVLLTVAVWRAQGETSLFVCCVVPCFFASTLHGAQMQACRTDCKYYQVLLAWVERRSSGVPSRDMFACKKYRVVTFLSPDQLPAKDSSRLVCTYLQFHDWSCFIKRVFDWGKQH